jgi:hypothetical protein
MPGHWAWGLPALLSLAAVPVEVRIPVPPGATAGALNADGAVKGSDTMSYVKGKDGV